MQYRLLLAGIVATGTGLLAGVAAAHAANETWVSGTGSDSGACPITAPCRTFAYAQTQTSNNGTINVLSSGNFGPLFINKPISIVAAGVEAVINTAHGGCSCGIGVNAPATAVISLRGLTIDMRGTNNSGISFATGRALHVSDMVIRRSLNGFNFIPMGAADLFVTDTVVADSSSTGILINPQNSASAKVVLERVRVDKGVNQGIWFRGDVTTGVIRGTVRDSVVSGYDNNSFLVSEAGGGTNKVTIDRTKLVNNHAGLIVTGAGAIARIGNSTVSGNSTAGFVAVSAGVIDSYGTNQVSGNFSNGSPTNTITMR